MTEASGHARDVLGDGLWGSEATRDGADAMAGGRAGVGAGPGGGGLDQYDATSASGEAGNAQEADGLSAVDVAEAWLAELADQVSVPASEVQDHLLDIWGVLDEGPARVEVERWLTETLRRNLYSVSDINDRLESLLPTA